MATLTCLSLLLLSGYIRTEQYVHHPVQYQSITDRGTYNFGYDTGLFGAHSLRREQKDEDGIVRGRYAYTDPNGKLRTVVYEAGPFGFRAKGDVGPDGYPQTEVGLPGPPNPEADNDTGIPPSDSLQGQGTHHIEYNVRSPLTQASSHPNRETKGYTYDSATHPDVSDRIFMPDSTHPRQVKPDPPVRLPEASSHPNSKMKGYTYDRTKHPYVENRTFVPLPSFQPRRELKPPPVPPPSPPSPQVVVRVPKPSPAIRDPAASSHPNRETKGYTYDPATHPNVQGRIYVPDSSRHRVHVSYSHPNHHTKGYTHDSSVHQVQHHPAPPAPRPPPQPSRTRVVARPSSPPSSPGYSKGYTPSRSEVIAVSRASSVSVSRASDNRPVYTKGYVTGSRAQASTQRHSHQPSVVVSRRVNRPPYTKGYITGSGSSRSVSRTSARSQHHDHDHMRSSSSSGSVEVTGFRQSNYVPKYMSVEEYLRRYRGDKDNRPQS